MRPRRVWITKKTEIMKTKTEPDYQSIKVIDLDKDLKFKPLDKAYGFDDRGRIREEYISEVIIKVGFRRHAGQPYIAIQDIDYFYEPNTYPRKSELIDELMTEEDFREYLKDWQTQFNSKTAKESNKL